MISFFFSFFLKDLLFHIRTFRQRDDNLKFGGEKRKGEGEIKCWGKKFEPHQLSGEQLESICLPLSPQITGNPSSFLYSSCIAFFVFSPPSHHIKR